MMKLLISKWRVLLIAIIIISGIFWFVQSRRQPEDSRYNPSTDEIVQAQVKDLQEILTLSGSIDAFNRADVHFQTAGRLSWVGVKTGDRVRRWQALASLDRQELRKQLEKNFNDYRSQLSQFQDVQDEYKVIRENNNLTDEMKRILDRSQFGLNNSVIAYELTDLSIKYATIFSPLDGIVVTAEPSVAGLNITPASATYTVIDPSSIYFKAEVGQEDVGRLNPGGKVIIRLDSFPDTEIESTITTISFTPIANRSSVVYAVNLTLPLDNQDLKYRLGMDGDANIILSQTNQALSVPADALIEEDDSQYLLVKTDNQVEKRAVKIGVETDDDVQILEGITANDQIVIKNR